jgi:hypothetical protein
MYFGGLLLIGGAGAILAGTVVGVVVIAAASLVVHALNRYSRNSASTSRARSSSAAR